MEYCDVKMKTRTNLYRNIGVHTKPLNGVSIRKKSKLWVFLQNMGREMHYSHEREFCVPVVHISHLEVIFSFHSERALHIKKKSNQYMSAYVRLTCQT